MPEFLTSALKPAGAVAPAAILLRLAVALVLGAIVAWIYRRARGPAASNGSFPGTLVLLSILIAMVTQVIGDNVARAFSLVGALSIVRFRTVVRDTQDTAYVIFAVVVGMAAGAQDLWVAGIGLIIVGLAALFLCRSSASRSELSPAWRLNLRLNIGLEPESVLGRVIDRNVGRYEFISAETVRQGIALDVTFHLDLRPAARPDALVQDLNRIEGVQSISLQRREFEGN